LTFDHRPSPVFPASVFGVDIRAAGVAYDGVVLFDGLDLHLAAGRIVCLLGPSGVGKSTLLRLVAGLAPASPGTSIVASDAKPLDGRIAWMAQQDLLCPWLDVLGNVSLGSRLRGTPSDRDKALALIAKVGLADKAHAMPATLSGGQRQRVALARTLMEDRPLVLMDEPFAALDTITRWRLQDLAATLLAGRTVRIIAEPATPGPGTPAQLELGTIRIAETVGEIFRFEQRFDAAAAGKLVTDLLAKTPADNLRIGLVLEGTPVRRSDVNRVQLLAEPLTAMKQRALGQLEKISPGTVHELTQATLRSRIALASRAPASNEAGKSLLSLGALAREIDGGVHVGGGVAGGINHIDGGSTCAI
jgi:putative hydroxymethylpyrimidine transport system ATP-binding protein